MSTIPGPPKHLSRRMRGFWRDIVREFALENHQHELLRLCCEALDRAEEARARIEADGAVIADRFGQLRPHPAVSIERDARIAAARLIRELSLDEDSVPGARPPRIR